MSDPVAPAPRAGFPSALVAIAAVLALLLLVTGLWFSRTEHPVERVANPREVALFSGEKPFEFLLGLSAEVSGSGGPGFLGASTVDWKEGGRTYAADYLDQAASDLEAFAASIANEESRAERRTSSERVARELRLRARAIADSTFEGGITLPAEWAGDDPGVTEMAPGLGRSLVLEHRAQTEGQSTLADDLREERRLRQSAIAAKLGSRVGTMALLGFLGLLAFTVLMFGGSKAWRVGDFEPARDGLDHRHAWGVFLLYWVGFQVLANAVSDAFGSSLSGVTTAAASLPLIGLLLLASRQTSRPFAALVGIELHPGRVLNLVGATLAGALLAFAGLYASQFLLGGLTDRSPWSNQVLDLVAGGGKHALPAFAIEAGAWAPLFEELAFRGVLFVGLRKVFGFGAAAGISSTLFGLSHGYDLLGQLGIVWVGFVLCLSVERTGSLIPAICTHALFNSLQVLLLSALL